VAHNNLGDLFFHLQRYPEAETEFVAALEDSSTYAPAHANLGQLYDQLKRYNEAEHEYRLAMQDITLVAPPNNLARILVEQKRPSEAVEILEPALDRFPETPALWRNYGRALLALGNVASGDSALMRSLQLDPEQPEVEADRARVAIEKARLEQQRHLGVHPPAVPNAPHPPGGPLPDPTRPNIPKP
jgi:Tfp pilus assembly protein PilF